MSALLIGIGTLSVGVFGVLWLTANGCSIQMSEGLLSFSVVCPFV